jgi:hypothetical protein
MRTHFTTRVILVAILALLLLPSVAQAQNYRPWKHALKTAFIVYVERYWYPIGVEKATAANEGYTIDAPAWFNENSNSWGEYAFEMASLTTAVYGEFPNGYLNAELRAFLRPFMAKPRRAVQAPLPPIVWPDWRSYMPTPPPIPVMQADPGVNYGGHLATS